MFLKIEGYNLFPGFVSLTSSSWRLVSFYNDSITAVDIHPSLPCGNLTIETCVNACGTAGFLLAGVEFTDKCYCGDKLENNSKGNPEEFCGGPDLLLSAFLMNDSDSQCRKPCGGCACQAVSKPGLPDDREVDGKEISQSKGLEILHPPMETKGNVSVDEYLESDLVGLM
ncbi:hypothetical protein K439DRAFT_1524608 [Ramaria rubella]|nr:hypothetical protein K439DRAFT_1524608 [Ramaria rubella]